MTESTAKPTLRVACSDDLDTALAMCLELFLEVEGEDIVRSCRDQISEEVKSGLENDNTLFVLAYIDTQLVGIVRADIVSSKFFFRYLPRTHCGYIDQMYIRPQFRSQRIGFHMIQHCENWFKEKKVKHSFLHAVPKAIRFYARMGYQPNREMVKLLD